MSSDTPENRTAATPAQSDTKEAELQALREQRAADRAQMRARRRKEARAAKRREAAEKTAKEAEVQALREQHEAERAQQRAKRRKEARVAKRREAAQAAEKAAKAAELDKMRARVEHFDTRASTRFKLRHFGLVLSFLLFVAAPVGGSVWYLWTKAADQYASYLGFLIQSEDNRVAADSLSGLVGGLTQSSSSNTDILYKFIQSQALVQRVNDSIDLKTIWSRDKDDVVFGYRGDGTIEALFSNWNRKVKIYYDQGTLDLRVLAFTPQDAQRITEMILDVSQEKINEINQIARGDKLRYAQEDLNRALERLKETRQAVTAFRNEYNMIDPRAFASGQEGILATLQQQLAEALIQLGVLRSNSRPGDQRIEQAKLRVDVIRQQIEEERSKVSSAGDDDGLTASEDTAISDVFSRYEALEVDRQFAEAAYTAALAGFDSARADANRQNLYLAPYVRPTLAQTAEYPQRPKLVAVLAGFSLLLWLVGVMIYYSMRDRR